MSAPTSFQWQITIYVGSTTVVYYSNTPPTQNGKGSTDFAFYANEAGGQQVPIVTNAAFIAVSGLYPSPPS